MKGFDSRFADFPDYILGITREIWEDRGIATLHEYYTENIVVRSPASVVIGNRGVIAATMATLAEFPDRQLLGEDVIWSGSPEAGMLSSHRLLCIATHAGDGVYGAATGTRLAYRAIADCHAINNRINDEWLVRDQTAIVRQLGRDPKDYARDLIAREGGPESCVRPFTPASDVDGPYTGRGNDNEWGCAPRGHPDAHDECRHGSDTRGVRPRGAAGIPGSRDRPRAWRRRPPLDGPARSLPVSGIPHSSPDRPRRSDDAAQGRHPMEPDRKA